MVTSNRWLTILVVTLAILPGCTGNSLDDGDSGDVVLQVTSLQTSPVTGEAEVGNCSVTTAQECLNNGGCATTEVCILPISGTACTVVDWTLQLANVPKTELAAESPFNDIVLSSLSVTYVEASPPFALLFSRVIPIAGTISAGANQSIQFAPITFADLTVDNTTLNMSAVVNGATVGGDNMSAAFGAQLFIEDCLP